MHFEKLNERFKAQEEERERIKVEGMEVNEVPEVNLYLRYQEKLKLNRKGHSASFKTITRTKRNNLVDGFNPIEKVPPIAYYRPNYNQVHPHQ